ncbi:MAG: STAS domain-containing protein [Spirochaetota bacterium]|jgi:anti-anti-sigma factor|nr:STAS domain-containing protein [Spirochaetota bacterium]
MDELVTRQVGDVLVISLSGRFDVHLSLEIEQAVNELIDKGHINLLFDLEKVVYLSSSGLRIFIAAMRKLEGLNGKLKLCNLTSSVKKIFKVVELIDLFDIHDSVDEAISAFRR